MIIFEKFSSSIWCTFMQCTFMRHLILELSPAFGQVNNDQTNLFPFLWDFSLFFGRLSGGVASHTWRGPAM